MERTFKFLLIVIALLQINLAYSQIVVNDGTCYSNVNFTEDGELNDRPRYASVAGDIIEWSGSRWEITTASSQIEYFNESDTGTPPCSSFALWTVNNACGVDAGSVVAGGSCATELLPVELVEFNGVYQSNWVHLNWRTASEVNNEKFEIEESTDGRLYNKIGEVTGNGTTYERSDYSFSTISVSNQSLLYYRLKQIDFDGKFEYSHAISVDTKRGGEVGEFFPNPSKSGLVSLKYDYEERGGFERIEVFDVGGNRLPLIPVAYGDNELGFDFSNMAKGVYYVKIGGESRMLVLE